MMNKIENWVKNNPIYGMCLVFVDLCEIAFGFAQLGENTIPAEMRTAA